MLTIILILLPLLCSLAIFFLKEERQIRTVALSGSLVIFLVTIYAFIQFRYSCKCLLLFQTGWLDTMGISLKFGMDGISLLLVLLTAFLVPLIILSTFSHRYPKPSAFYGLILLMEMALIGVFTAFDGLMFYIFWELALITAWFICAYWGGQDRIRITFKFFAYTFTGSLLMLVTLIWLYLRTPLPHSFDFQALYATALTPSEQVWVFAALFVAFAVKMPVFPFHTWQPDTYAVSPPAGTMLLAGIMLKMGTYGLIRWLIPIAPDAVHHYGFIAIILALTGLVYASVIAIRQDDMKRLVAWSSIAHVGLIAAGILTLTQVALQGAVIQMLSHGINIVGLFIIIDLIEQRMNTRSIRDLGGLAFQAPWLAVFFMIIVLGTIALPLTNGFVGEFMLLLGLYEYREVFAAVGGLTVIFSAVYMLWMYQRVMHGKPAGGEVGDLTKLEIVTLVPVVVMIFWIGIFPDLFIGTAGPDITALLSNLKP